MHICYLCDEYPPNVVVGGVGTFTQALARALVGRGHRVTVLGIQRRPDEARQDDQGVEIIRLPHTRVPKAGYLAHSRLLRRTLEQVHAAQPIDVLEGAELALSILPRRAEFARIIRMHGGHHFFAHTLGKPTGAWRAWRECRSFARADALCAVSHFVAETTRELLALGDRAIEVIPNPVDTSRFRPRPDVPVTPGRLVFVGTVCEKKGVRQLVQAMPGIVDAVPTAHLQVIGRDSREAGESFTERLQALVPDALRAHITFTGPVDHETLPERLAAAEVCVYPSHMEAMPLAWLEGLAMGRPVVASATGPGPEAIEDGVSGLLCDPHDPAAIADTVIRALTDATLRRQLGAAARERAETLFAADVLVSRNETFYASLSARE
jgi:glycosyltransferase involved in cell wall biosynthesis